MNYQSCEVLHPAVGYELISVENGYKLLHLLQTFRSAAEWKTERKSLPSLTECLCGFSFSLSFFFFTSLFNHLLPLFPLFLPSHMFYWLHLNILKGLQELVCMAPTNPRPRAWFRDFLTKNLSLLPYLPKCEALTMTTSLWKAQLSNVVYKSDLKFVARVA